MTKTATKARPKQAATSTDTPDVAQPLNQTEIPISGQKFAVGGADITKIIVTPISFASFVGISGKVSGSVTNASDWKVFTARQRAAVQCALVSASGSTVKFTDQSFSELPRTYASKLLAALDDDTSVPGTVVSEGNGIDRPCLFKLGTPIKTHDGREIHELEFNAPSMGSMERVFAASGGLAKALALIEHCAQPIGEDVTLIRLPQWAIDQVSMADGLAVMADVLPGFLE